MKKSIIPVVFALSFIACDNKNEYIDSPRGEVYRKEYRTIETIREDEIFGTLHNYSKYTFDVPYEGKDGYADWIFEELNSQDSVIQFVKYMHPFKYKQNGQFIIVNYDDPKSKPDTILYLGDSIIDYRNETYYYYGPVSIE